MGKFVKGFRFVPHKLVGLIAAGRTMEEQIEDIKREGMYFTPAVLRNSIIGGLEIKRRKGPEENLIIIGCACYGTALPLRSYFQLLDGLDIGYAVLTKEYCCGFPIIEYEILNGEGRERGDEAAREFIGLNLEQARERGARSMVHFCTWCAYLARRFYPNEEVTQLFYPDILLERLERETLRVKPTTVGYFSGTPHRKPVLVLEDNWDFDWRAYRGLLDRIEGLKVIDIPRYCCQVADWAIWERARREGVDTIVTSCIVCYGRLSRRAPQGFKMRFLSDILLEALS